jgi:hypothetical protein
MQHEGAVMYPEADTSYQMEIIGTYQQRADEVMHDAKQQSSFVTAGGYPVVGCVANATGLVNEGGVIFDAVDLTTNEPRTVIAFKTNAQLRDLEQSGMLALADGVDRAVLEDRALVQAAQQGMRR